MWGIVRSLRAAGVTIILTTHYIEEAEQMAELMRKLGKKQMTLHLHAKLDAIPAALAAHRLILAGDGTELVYTYDTQAGRTGITTLLHDLGTAGIGFRDLNTTQSSLEDIFVDLVRRGQ